MKCALCKENDANKKNTHYLTDGIIRSCLNQDGSQRRGKGFYFDMSSNTALVEFNFQQETSVAKLEEALGRQATDEEIERAKEIPFSVDDVFCSDCEKRFTKIEDEFIKEILPKLRDSDLSSLNELTVNEGALAWAFYYLQVWRTSVCTEAFSISDDVSEQLRLFILNRDTEEPAEMPVYPMAVSYLTTVGGPKEFTRNFVGFGNVTNPNLVLMNDFVIQFYEDEGDLPFFDFHTLNTPEDYLDFINLDPKVFKHKIISNDGRNRLLRSYNAERAKNAVEFYKNNFVKLWSMLTQRYPSEQIVNEYLDELINGDEFNILKYSKLQVIEKTTAFIKSKLNVR